MKIFTAQKKKFSINNSFSNYVKPQETADLVTFTEKIFNAKLHFLYSDFNFVLLGCSKMILFCWMD